MEVETPPSWAKLGHVGTFFALGRLFSALGRLLRVCWAFFTHVVRFCRVLGRSRIDFGVFCDAPGRVLKVPGQHFGRFFRARTPVMRKSSECVKIIIFPRSLLCLTTSHVLRTDQKNKRNRFWSLLDGSFHEERAKISSWAPLGSIL